MLHEELSQREAQGMPIRLGVSGAGWIGSGFVYQVERMPGMRVDILADPDIALARRAFEACGVPAEKIVETESSDAAADAIGQGRRVVTGSYRLAAEVPAVDIVADVTPSPDSGAETAMGCIEHGKDVVMVNIEADVTVGRILKHLAERAGVLYTVSSGDEPGCLMELWDFVTSLGFEPIVIGKGKNNPLNPLATPDDVAEIGPARRQRCLPGGFICRRHQDHVRNGLLGQRHRLSAPTTRHDRAAGRSEHGISVVRP